MHTMYMYAHRVYDVYVCTPCIYMYTVCMYVHRVYAMPNEAARKHLIPETTMVVIYHVDAGNPA